MIEPVSVCHQVSTIGHAVAADDLAVPHVRLGVDRLTDRPEQPQRGHVELVGDVAAPLHEGPDRGRGGVEDRHAVLLDDLPPAALVRAVRGAFVHHLRRTVGERAVDDVAVPGDPADVGRAPVDVGLRLEVEDRPVRVRRADEVAAGGVQDALGLAGRAGGVHHVERVLGVERLGLVVGGGAVDGVVPPHVDLVVPGDLLAGTAYDEHVVDHVGLGAGLVDGRLERRGGAAAVAAVGGDDDPGLAVGEAGGQRVGGEAAEDHRVRGADPGAGQHRDDRLGDHRQVDRDPVAGADAERDQRVGGLADLVLELGVGQRAGVVGGLADPVQRHLVAAPGLDVPVDAVVRRVELAADEPLGEGLVVPVEDPVPLLRPVQATGLLLPERQPVVRGCVVRRRGEVGVRGEVGRRLEAALLVHEVGQGLVLVAHDLS